MFLKAKYKTPIFIYKLNKKERKNNRISLHADTCMCIYAYLTIHMCIYASVILRSLRNIANRNFSMVVKLRMTMFILFTSILYVFH